MLNTAWLTPMIGVPFAEKGRTPSGWDCWGCVRWGLKAGFGIDVPTYADDYLSTTEGDEIAAVIHQASLSWQELPLSDARPGDVLILRIMGQPWHCGLVLDPPRFLHAEREVGTVMERWDGLRWARRTVAVYRHPELMSRPLAGSSVR